MTELKTLKDMGGYHIEHFEKNVKDYSYEKIHGTSFYELRQEAIKQIHQLRNVKTDFNSFDNIAIDGAIDWIKHFFNIIEEDLEE